MENSDEMLRDIKDIVCSDETERETERQRETDRQTRLEGKRTGQSIWREKGWGFAQLKKNTNPQVQEPWPSARVKERQFAWTHGAHSVETGSGLPLSSPKVLIKFLASHWSIYGKDCNCLPTSTSFFLLFVKARHIANGLTTAFPRSPLQLCGALWPRSREWKWRVPLYSPVQKGLGVLSPSSFPPSWFLATIRTDLWPRLGSPPRVFIISHGSRTW